MRITRVLPAALTAAAVAVALPATASAQDGSDPTASAKFGSKIETTPTGTSATLKVRYRCSVGETLWISAKQVVSGEPDPALMLEGSSQISAAWWQSHRNPITCDGRKHKQTFTLDLVEPGSKGRFVDDGKAWVQFCVTQGEDNLTLSEAGWVRTDTDD